MLGRGAAGGPLGMLLPERARHGLSPLRSRSRRCALGLSLALAAALGLSACNLGPDVDPSLPADAGYPAIAQNLNGASPPGSRQHLVASLDIPGQWWTLFHSRALNALVETALQNNPDLAAAQAALLRARENALAERSGFFPQLNGGFNGTGRQCRRCRRVAAALRLARLYAADAASQR